MSAEHMPSEDRLRELLVGRSIVKAEIEDCGPGVDWHDVGPTGSLTLDDGTVLKLWGNDGGCACNAGCYPLEVLNEWPNAISNVVVEESPGGEYDAEFEGHYRIFVIAEDRHLIASFEGTDGNGYYGTGWWLSVAKGGAA